MLLHRDLQYTLQSGQPCQTRGIHWGELETLPTALIELLKKELSKAALFVSNLKGNFHFNTSGTFLAETIPKKLSKCRN